MCQRARCPHCQKATYAGCGRHAEQVLADVPSYERCRCREHAERSAEERERRWMDEVFGRG